MSSQRKQESVLRLLLGEDLELVSRELGVTAADLSGWRDSFLAGGAASLKSRPEDPRDRELRAMKESCPSRRHRFEPDGRRRADHGERASGGEDRPDGGRRPFCAAEVEEMSRTVFALREALLWSGSGLQGLALEPVDDLAPRRGRQSRRGAAPPTRSARPHAGWRACRQDPGSPGEQPLSWRGLSQGLGPPAGWRCPHQPAPRPPGDARARPAGTSAPWRVPRSPGA